MRGMMLKRFGTGESIFKLCLLAFLLLLIWVGRAYPEKSRLFPELLIAITFLFVILSFLYRWLSNEAILHHHLGQVA